MRVLAVTALVVMAAMLAPTGPAGAQGGDRPHVNLLTDTPSKTPEEKEEQAAREKAYKESLKKIPDAKAPNDPWGMVRSDTTKTPPATKPKARTGTSAN
jgi:hypothetical protein